MTSSKKPGLRLKYSLIGGLKLTALGLEPRTNGLKVNRLLRNSLDLLHK